MARGPNVARESFQLGPQSPKFCLFGMIFNENIMKIGKNYPIWPANISVTFFWPAMKSELSIPALE